MTGAGLEKVLRGCGVGLLLLSILLGAGSVVHVAGRQLPLGSSRIPAEPVALGGTVEVYGEGTITVLTTTKGLRVIAVSPDTVVTDANGPAQISDLLPGQQVTVWGEADAPDRALRARTILVWGSPR
jgi:hypothetical protein